MSSLKGLALLALLGCTSSSPFNKSLVATPATAMTNSSDVVVQEPVTNAPTNLTATSANSTVAAVFIPDTESPISKHSVPFIPPRRIYTNSESPIDLMGSIIINSMDTINSPLLNGTTLAEILDEFLQQEEEVEVSETLVTRDLKCDDMGDEIPSDKHARFPGDELVPERFLPECHRKCWDSEHGKADFLGDVREMSASDFCDKKYYFTGKWLLEHVGPCIKKGCKGCGKKIGDKTDRFMEYVCDFH
ncbi:hypothetical protein F5Y16DRAFT_416073 [Xylariaceae sp. FL0255]|nr:hypothetical protein F5Y16DRAFT_416073 [Xylariaceae sp. FL0255]